MNKTLKWILIVVAAVAVGAFFLVSRIINMGLPDYGGTVGMPGLHAEVKVYRDAYAVPHIEAADEHDAAMALGYAHAQDRLFQMVAMRHLVSGRMAELFGDMPFHMEYVPAETMSEFDRFMRVLGFGHYAGETASGKDVAGRELIDAYVAGINAFIESDPELPPEFLLLGHRPEPWTVEEVVMLGRYIGWSLSNNWHMELNRLQAIAHFGLERGWELFPRHSHPGPYVIPAGDNRFLGRGKKVAPLYMPPGMDPDKLPKSLFNTAWEVSGTGCSLFSPYASNNWAVSGGRTKSGAPILCNDPHLTHMLPSVFYQAHLKTGDGLDVIGVTFAGMPFMTLGHNRRVAWAATTTRADNQDLFIERADPDNPEQYWDPTIGDWREFEEREEIIRVKGGEDKKVVVRSSRHGPVISDILAAAPGAPPIAVRWGGFDPGTGYLAFQKIMRARSAEEMVDALALMDVPIQNWVFADTEGNIGYYASGYYPVRPEGCDGTLPARGDTTDCDWLGRVPPEEQPMMLNPRRGYVISANNKVIDENEYPHVVSFNYAGYRAERIEELLNSKERLTPGDMREFQMDVYMMQARRLAPYYLEAYEREGDKEDTLLAEAVKVLGDWDHVAGTDSAGPSIFHRAYYETIVLALKDELPPEMYNYYLNEKSFLLTIDNAIERNEFSFFDDVNTKEVVETRDQILAAALKRAARELERLFGPNIEDWQWGKMHTLEFAHPFSSQKPLDLVFKRFTMPSPGTGGTVFSQAFNWGKDILKVQYGPAFRQVIDMSDIGGATMIIDTGQSGHVRSPHLFDQNEMWLTGGTIPMVMDMEKVKSGAKAVMTLKPAEK
ncbi:MAG: penicillin acylase family protein [bacterium]